MVLLLFLCPDIGLAQRFGGRVLYTGKNKLVDIIKQKRSDHFNEYKRVYRGVNVFNRMRGGSTGASCRGKCGRVGVL